MRNSSDIQAMLEGSRSNRHVYGKISKEMEEMGFSKTADQCASKTKKQTERSRMQIIGVGAEERIGVFTTPWTRC